MKIIAGPCVIENIELLREVAQELVRIRDTYRVETYFKASFDKANRTSLSSFRGPGIEQGIAMLESIRQEFGLPITTDFHTPEQIIEYGQRVDIVQIPAFLCRQTDMLIAAGKTGKIVNIKKAQFLNAEKMKYAVDKVKSTGNQNVWLTERGTLYGPSELVVDFRNIQKLGTLTDHVVMDCTHAAQETQGNDGKTGGNRAYVPFFAKTAKLWGANAFFLETHPNPDQGLSDGPNMLKLSDLDALVRELI
ncbi:MAG: 3-deoxy-8-phosphooctulonate synthase [Schleiferiaceae bacterium]|jgi:2-dehydro-3-deoxyphosphooctonate aldolase (KDO 8-P synthase)|nr:3-deoxy-8-phosphooctulonate synthase [Schleiferiaceae bacterium]MDA8819565.1 3-deoxy-8-phosphooctulonate synthase [Schleiferiaceae bacterium]PSR07114.1 MAG: 3-deoxy-8-phosphooctulonate synthase [Bacteroidota bacterium]